MSFLFDFLAVPFVWKMLCLMAYPSHPLEMIKWKTSTVRMIFKIDNIKATHYKENRHRKRHHAKQTQKKGEKMRKSLSWRHRKKRFDFAFSHISFPLKVCQLGNVYDFWRRLSV